MHGNSLNRLKQLLFSHIANQMPTEFLLALHFLLEKKGKKVETIYPTKPEAEIKRQPNNVLINQHCQIPDLLIICDTSTYERIYYPELFKALPSINIDHHISNNIAGTIN